MTIKDTSQLAGIWLTVSSAVSFAVVLYWRATNGSRKLEAQIFCWCLLPVASRHPVRMLWVCLGLFIPSDLYWLFPFIHEHVKAETPAGFHSLLFCTSRRKDTSGVRTVSGRCFAAFLLTAERDGVEDQLAHVNHDRGLNIKGSW